MRFVPENEGVIKAVAKRLRDFSGVPAAGMRQLKLAQCLDLVCQRHGYRGWHDFGATPRIQPSPLDHEVEPPVRAARRRQQAAVLVELGIKDTVAAAVIAHLLPSGGFEDEMEAFRARVERSAVAGSIISDDLRLNTAWIMDRLDLPESERPWAVEVAKVWIATSGGILVQNHRWVDNARLELARSRSGYWAVVVEERSLYQGFLLTKPSPEALANVDWVIEGAKARFALGTASAPPDDAALNDGAQGGSLSGALQASILRYAVEGRAKAAGALAWRLSELIGLDRFVVVAVGSHDGGCLTEVSPLSGKSVEDARRAIEALPAVIRIQDGLLRQVGIDPLKYRKSQR